MKKPRERRIDGILFRQFFAILHDYGIVFRVEV